MNDIHRLLFDDQYSPSLSLLLAVTTTRKRQEKKVENRSQMLFIFILFVPRWRRNGSVYRMESSYSPILKYSHRNRTDTRSVSFLYPSGLRYLPISTPFFPYISLSSLRIDESRSGLRGTKGYPCPSFFISLFPHSKSNFNDHSRFRNLFEIGSNSPLQFQRLLIRNNEKSEERERERGFWWESFEENNKLSWEG